MDEREKYEFSIARPSSAMTIYHIYGCDEQNTYYLDMRLFESIGKQSRLEVSINNAYSMPDGAAITGRDIFGLRNSFNAIARQLIGFDYPFPSVLVEQIPVGKQRYIGLKTNDASKEQQRIMN
ncbi:hypothetical protein HY488_00330 [Candidatus Woesearchaeota archaeon]|nr:hypothetical protein [Candidatus Woesearchaeota archaeon]